MSSEPAAPSSGYAVRMATVMSTVIGVNIGYMAVLPFLPRLAEDLSLDRTGLLIFVAGFGIAKVLAQPVGGWTADRWGQNLTGVTGLVVAAAGMTLVAFATDGSVALAGRLIWGAGDGLVSPAIYGAVGTLSARYGRDSSRGYARLGVAAVLSFGAGPLIIGLVHSFAGYPVILSTAAGLTLLTALVAWWALPGRARDAPAGDAAAADLAPDPVWSSRVLRAAVLFGAIDLCSNLAWAAMEPLVPLYMDRAVADSVGRSAWVLAFGMAVFAGLSPLIARLPGRWRRPGASAAGLLLLAAACVALGGVDRLVVALPGMAAFMAAQAFIYLVARDGILRHCGGTGRAWGVFGMLSDVGFMIGPGIGVLLFQAFGSAAFPFLGVGSALCAVLIFLILRSTRILTASHLEVSR
ncbi:MFS transporter [Actinoplanes sp. NPDC051346]|uniref:MFS transporter n=1 Tax=Actinoplanes sp. NPDC051346 TaxID=3155048 RepID=UPI003436CDD8